MKSKWKFFISKLLFELGTFAIAFLVLRYIVYPILNWEWSFLNFVVWCVICFAIAVRNIYCDYRKEYKKQ